MRRCAHGSRYRAGLRLRNVYATSSRIPGPPSCRTASSGAGQIQIFCPADTGCPAARNRVVSDHRRDPTDLRRCFPETHKWYLDNKKDRTEKYCLSEKLCSIFHALRWSLDFSKMFENPSISARIHDVAQGVWIQKKFLHTSPRVL